MWFSLVVRITSNYSIWPLRLLCVLWLLDEIHNKKETQLFSMLGRLVSYTAPTNREKATQFDVHLAHKKTKFLNFIWLSVEKKFYRTEELGGNDVKLFRISLLGISRKEFRRWAASIAQTCVWHMRIGLACSHLNIRKFYSVVWLPCRWKEKAMVQLCQEMGTGETFPLFSFFRWERPVRHALL